MVEWSSYQQDIFKDVIEGKQHSVVESVAGSGKTATLIETIKRIPNKRSKVLAVAFNKKIQLELDEKIGKSYITVKTLHSFGLQTIRNAFRSVKIVPDKTKHIILDLFKDNPLVPGDLFLLEKIVYLCKASIVDAPSKIDTLMDVNDIDPIDLDRDDFIKSVVKVLSRCKVQKESVGYDDMVWFPIVFGLPIEKFDYVFIDEMQDFTAAQWHIAISACKPGGRIFAYGDRFQCLYAWAGVDIDAVPKTIERLDAKVFSLPVSYRCPKKVIELAQEIVPEIKPAPNAKDGEIIHLEEVDLDKHVKPGDFVLSRANAPLIRLCLSFLRKGIKANIQGRDLGDTLLFMLKKSKKKTTEAFLKWLKDWRNSEVKRLQEKKRSVSLVYDKYECLTELCEGTKSLTDVEENIKTLFKDVSDDDKVVFSTCHRAKGLQRPNVFVLRYTFRPEEGGEAANLFYVAVTRAQDRLYLVSR